MTHFNDTTLTRKGKHLSYAERAQIAVLKENKFSNRRIALSLGRAPQTINNEIHRGKVTQLKRQKQNGKTYDYYITIYDGDVAQANYDKQRLNCGRRPKWADTDTFIKWADKKMLNDQWSPDAVVGFAKRHDLFNPSIIPCTTTLYNWIDRGVMRTRNIDLLEKLSRKPKATASQKLPNKRVLGPSIDQRPKSVKTRQSFGHWEIDTVLGSKEKSDAALLTLVERQTRFKIILKVDGKDQASINQAIGNLKKRSDQTFSTLFKLITSDNGSEFSGLYDAL